MKQGSEAEGVVKSGDDLKIRRDLEPLESIHSLYMNMKQSYLNIYRKLHLYKMRSLNMDCI